MIAIDHTAAAFVAMVMAVWLIVAVWVTALGLRRAAAARAAVAENARLSALIASAPAIPLRIGLDGRIEAGERLAAWLGMARLPRTLDDLAGAGSDLLAEDVEGLQRDVSNAQRAARSFVRPLRIAGTDRILMARGGPAGKALGQSALVWLHDASESQREIARLDLETRRVTTALESLSGLIEAAPFPMWYRGPDLRLGLVNSAYVRAVEGDSAADVIGRGLELVEFTGGTSPLVSAAGARDSGALSIRTAPATIGGERRMMRIVDVPIGETGVAGYAVDVEELEEARADLGRFARAQRDMLDRLSAGVIQFGPDRSLVFFNHHFVRLFAMKPEWLADGPEFDRVLERMREAQRVPESRDFPGWKAERRAWFNATSDAIEENWLLPSGMHLRVLAQPLPDGGLLLIFEDRTEQIQLASARDTLLRVRAATFDNLFEAIGVFAADGRLHIWNSRFRELWGLSEEELALHPRVDVLVEAVGKRLVNPARAGLIRELVRIATVDRQQRSGRIALTDGRHFEFAAVPLPDGNALFTLLDITASRGIEAALRERAEALEEADRLKTAFVAKMSYELRVPLTSIGGFAEMLAGGYAGPLEDRAREYVEAILASVTRLGPLIEDVLDLTQSEAGSLPLARENVDLAILAREVAETKVAVAEHKPLSFVVELAEDAGIVIGDARRLRQTINNLLDNALFHTPAGGRVLFRVVRDGDTVEIIVSDNGPGIAPALRDRIFDRFQRIHSEEKSGEGKGDGGLPGLGLPLSRQFVEAHGGTIGMTSEPGEGTTVVVHLPRAMA